SKIGGPGKLVQIDETKVGHRKCHRGQWVFGGIEEAGWKVVFVAVPDRTGNTLLPIIKESSVIVSYCWRSYSKLEEEGYNQQPVNHSEEFVNEQGWHTNKIEGHWRLLK
ncbi:predicted protein, partial [Nematostella vectensis]